MSGGLFSFTGGSVAPSAMAGIGMTECVEGTVLRSHDDGSCIRRGSICAASAPGSVGISGGASWFLGCSVAAPSALTGFGITACMEGTKLRSRDDDFCKC